MTVRWIDVSDLSFNALLLLERVQLSWLPGWVPERELGIALRANPAVEWFMRHKCPEIHAWLDDVLEHSRGGEAVGSHDLRAAEVIVMNTINDLLTYAVDPSIYDAQPFLGWNSSELTSLVDFAGKTVVDVGSGTGRLALVAAPLAKWVFAVEPVGNLRRYIAEKAERMGMLNVYPIDGLITSIPLPSDFADVTMGGHVFGDHPEEECRELERVTRRGGMVVLCPGNNDKDNREHEILVAKGFQWSRFEEPGDGWKRKYWKKVEISEEPGDKS